MNIVSNSIRIINDEKQVVFFTLTNNNAVDYLWHTNTPTASGSLLQDYLDVNLDMYYLYILKKQYPDANYSTFTGDSDLEKMEDWITQGNTNPIIYEDLQYTTEVSIPTYEAETMVGTHIKVGEVYYFGGEIEWEEYTLKVTYPETVIDLVTWKDTHIGTTRTAEVLDRGKISAASATAVTNATTLEQLRDAVATILLGNNS